MTWNWLDFLIIALALTQIGLFVAIVLVLGRIKSGAVARFVSVVGRNIESGKRLVATGKAIGTTSLPRLQAIRVRLATVPRYLRPVKLEADISVGKIARYAGMAQLLLAKPGKDASPRRKRAGFVERVGLIPPVWQKIAPLWGYVGIAVSAWREVQKQLPQIRRAVSEAQQKRIDKPAESGL